MFHLLLLVHVMILDKIYFWKISTEDDIEKIKCRSAARLDGGFHTRPFSRSLVCTGSHHTRLKVFVTLLRGSKQMSQDGYQVKEIFIEKGNHEAFYSMTETLV